MPTKAACMSPVHWPECSTARPIGAAHNTKIVIVTKLRSAVLISPVETTAASPSSERWSWNKRERAAPMLCNPNAIATVCVLSSTSSMMPYCVGLKKRE